MRKKSKYKPKGVRLDVMTYVKSGLLPLSSVGSEAVKLKIINHDALNNLRMGTGTKMDFDTMVESMNVAEAFAMHNHGGDWRPEIRLALDALFDLGVRAKNNGMRFTFKPEELKALQLAMEIHDAQLDEATVNQLEQAIHTVRKIRQLKQARVIK